MAEETHEQHGYYTGDVHNQFVPEHRNPKAVKIIWRTFWILLIATAVEVGIGFKASLFDRNLLIAIFVILTIFKAYFIVAIFMHLKGEKLSLKYSIILPFFLILFLIILMLVEGTFVFEMG